MPRGTNDFDLFLLKTDVPRALEVLNAAGYRTEVAYAHWLGKAHFDGGFIDRARSVAEFMNGRSGSGTSAQPGNPSDTYGRYVVGY